MRKQSKTKENKQKPITSRTYIRKVRMLPTEKQVSRYDENIFKARVLHNYTVEYLENVYGKDHLDRHFPTKDMDKRYLMQKIIDQFNTAFPEMKKMLHSQAAHAQVMALLTNFGLYHKTLQRASKMSDKNKKDYLENKHKNNPNHKTWYRKGSLRYYHDGEDRSPQTITIPNNGQIRFIGEHHIKIQDYGVVCIKENLSAYKKLNVVQTKIKRHKNGTFEMQLVISEEVTPFIGPFTCSAGGDWNTYNNEVIAFSDGTKIKVPDELYKRLVDIKKQIKGLDRQIDININKNNRTQRRLLVRREKLYRKLCNIRDEWFKKIAKEIADKYDRIAVEDLDTTAFRSKKREDRNFNSKLALLAPYRMYEILEWELNKRGRNLYRVDPAYTTQVEFGTRICIKRPRDVRWWIGVDGELVDRDVNAAKNIKDWSEHPENHALLWVDKNTLRNIGRGEPSRPETRSGNNVDMSVSTEELKGSVVSIDITSSCTDEHPKTPSIRVETLFVDGASSA